MVQMFEGVARQARKPYGHHICEDNDMFCGLVVLWNAGVRGARLLLAVARGAQKCVGRIRAELWSSMDPRSDLDLGTWVFWTPA